MSSMYIRSQDREKLYRLGGNYACVEYGSATARVRELEQHRWQCELEHCARSFLSNYGRLTKCPGNSYTAGG